MEPNNSPAKPTPMHWLPIMLILLMITIIAVVFFANVDKKIQHTAITDLPARIRPTPSSSPAPDITDSWKVYTDAQAKYSLRYPPETTPNITTDGPAKTARFVYMGPTQKASGRIQTELFDGYFVTILTSPLSEHFDIRIAAEKSRQGIIGVGYGDDCKVSEVITGMIGATRTARYRSKNCMGDYIVIIAQNAGHAVTLTGMYTSEEYFTQINRIFNTLEFTDTQTDVPETSPLPASWTPHVFPAYNLTMYSPDDWQSTLENFSGTSLITFRKKSSPSIIPIQMEIKPDWYNTGNASTLAKNYTVGSGIGAIRVDPPAKQSQQMERYQSNIYFEYDAKVYVFQCVHNWEQDYLDTCNTMLQTLKFSK